jgi:anti-anti-sigma factor
VVLLSGDVGPETAARLEAFVAARLPSGYEVLDVDLGGVVSVGSVGLSALLGLRRSCLQRGIELRVRGAQPSVWRVFEVTGLDSVFAPSGGAAHSPPAQDLALF